MWISVLTGCVLIFITILIHAFTTKYAMFLTYKAKNRPDEHWISKFRIQYPESFKMFYVSRIIILMFFASLIEAFVWACAYKFIGVLDSFEDAMYFSIVTLTTLGYGDITLASGWRMLGAFEASIGIIMFGWSTAIVMATVQKLYFNVNWLEKEKNN